MRGIGCPAKWVWFQPGERLDPLAIIDWKRKCSFNNKIHLKAKEKKLKFLAHTIAWLLIIWAALSFANAWLAAIERNKWVQDGANYEQTPTEEVE